MSQEVHNAVTKFLKNYDSWARPKNIVKALYPKFSKKYDEATFKRIVFRVLKSDDKIIKNFHTPHYAIKKPQRIFTEGEIKLIQKFFEMVENPNKKSYIPLSLSNQPPDGTEEYPEIPLERTYGFRKVRATLRRLWTDPRDIRIFEGSAIKTRETIDQLRSARGQDS